MDLFTFFYYITTRTKHISSVGTNSDSSTISSTYIHPLPTPWFEWPFTLQSVNTHTWHAHPDYHLYSIWCSTTVLLALAVDPVLIGSRSPASFHLRCHTIVQLVWIVQPVQWLGINVDEYNLRDTTNARKLSSKNTKHAIRILSSQGDTSFPTTFQTSDLHSPLRWTNFNNLKKGKYSL